MSSRKKPYGDELKSFLEQWAQLDKQGKMQLCANKSIAYATGKEWAMCGYVPARDDEPVPSQVSKEEDKPVIVNLPQVKLQTYKARRVKRGDEESATVHVSDNVIPAFDNMVSI